MQFVKFEHQPIDEDYKILKELGYDDARIKFIDSLYSFDFLEILQDDCGSSGGGGISFICFNIDLKYVDKEQLQILLKTSKNSYIPFVNSLEKQSQFAFCFHLTTIENYEKYTIEFAYRNKLIEKEQRNQLHSTTKDHIKKDFYEDRRLYNLSSNWDVLNPKKVLNLEYPKQIYIGLLNRCNVECPNCPWFSKTHSKTHTNDYFKTIKRLPTDKVYEILDFAAKGNSKVVFSGPGEPLLDDRIFDFVEYAKKQGITDIEVATNGVLVTPEIFKKLTRYGVKFSCMIKFESEVYSGLGDDFYATYKSNLLQITRECKQNSFSVILFVVCAIDKFSEAFAFYCKLKQITKNVRFYISKMDGKDWECTNGINRNRYSCCRAIGSLYVFPSGDVGACEWQRLFLGREDVSKISLGNILKDSIQNIWCGKIRNEFVRKHLNKECLGSICENCGSGWWNDV